MKRLVVAIGIILLSSCQSRIELSEIRLDGSWQWTSKGGDFPFYGGIPVNYQELYINGDSINTFNPVLGNQVIPWRVHENTVFSNGVEIATIKPINEKRLLLIHQQGVDTLTYIDNLNVPQNTFYYKNTAAFGGFIKGFKQRMEKYYVETLGIDFTKLPSTDLKPVDEIISDFSTEDKIEKK